MGLPFFSQFCQTLPVPWLAAVGMEIVNELGLGVAVVLTVVGMGMHWHLPRHRMSLEERAKDGKLTESAAHRRVRLYSICATITTVAGMAVLVLVLLDFSN